MKIKTLFFCTAILAATLLFSCTKKELRDAVALELSEVIGTWEGEYAPAVTKLGLSEISTITIKAVAGSKEEVVIDTQAQKNIKAKVSTNAIVGITFDLIEQSDLESGTCVYTKNGTKLVLTVKGKGEGSKSYLFKSTTKKN
jgi:lipoprotein